MKKRWIRIISVTCIVTVTLWFLQRLLMPKYMTDIVEGSLIEEYYDETTDHDVIFVGDCEVYENFSPMTLWEDYGITSYIRGSAQQLIWQSYYLLEETLRYEIPKVVVFNVLSMKYNDPQNEAYNRMTLDGMKWSMSKYNSIESSMLEEENMLDYIFPLLRYHSRWDELSTEDITYLFHKDKIAHNGYYMRVDTKGVTTVPEGKKLTNYQFGDRAYEYLDKMTQLCKDNGIEFVLVKAPSVYPYWYDEWDQQMVEYANKNNLTYINFLDKVDEVGIDFTTDTYDTGLHMNLSGAEKCSKYLGQILMDDYKLKDHRKEKEYASVYKEKLEFYNAMKEDQYNELEQYGYLKSYGAKPTDE